MNFNHYFTNQEIEELITAWVKDYPKLVQTGEIGRSYEGRPIWLLTLTNQETGPDIDKPAVWLDANIHATEVAGTTTTLNIAHQLLTGYGNDPELTQVLDSSVYYIAPRLNPDGAALALSDRPQYLRSGVRPYPYPEREEGLHAEDIDGDGRLLQMRIPDHNGDWKVSSLDPRLMEKRGPAESGGTYYRLLPEGRLEDYDGYVIKVARPLQGLDFNRNFPFEWQPEEKQHGAGPYPASEPEIKAMLDFITGHPNINLAVAYHTYSRAILRPYSTRPDDEMETQDLWVYKQLGELGTQMTGYRSVSVYHDFRYHPKEVTAGAFDDWLYDHLGAFSFTIELWDLPTEAGIQDRKFIEWFREHPHEQDLQILQWVDEHAGEDAYVEWYPFQHPQIGLIELGGWNTMFTWRNPPPALMGAEAERNAGFGLALGKLLPRLQVHTLEWEKLEEGRFHLNLAIENAGYLSTSTSLQGRKRKAARPVRVELELPDEVRLVSGRRKVELGHLEGRSSRLSVSAVGAASPTDNRARAEWVFQGPPGAEILVHIRSDRAGNMERRLRL